MKHIADEKLNFDWKVVIVTVLSTLLLITDRYYNIFEFKYWDRVLWSIGLPGLRAFRSDMLRGFLAWSKRPS